MSIKRTHDSLLHLGRGKGFKTVFFSRDRVALQCLIHADVGRVWRDVGLEGTPAKPRARKSRTPIGLKGMATGKLRRRRLTDPDEYGLFLAFCFWMGLQIYCVDPGPAVSVPLLGMGPQMHCVDCAALGHVLGAGMGLAVYACCLDLDPAPARARPSVSVRMPLLGMGLQMYICMCMCAHVLSKRQPRRCGACLGHTAVCTMRLISIMISA